MTDPLQPVGQTDGLRPDFVDTDRPVTDPLAGRQPPDEHRTHLTLRERVTVWFMVRKVHSYMEGKMPQILKNVWQSKGSSIVGAVLGILTWAKGEFPGAHWLAVVTAVVMAISNDHGQSAK